MLLEFAANSLVGPPDLVRQAPDVFRIIDARKQREFGIGPMRASHIALSSSFVASFHQTARLALVHRLND